MKEGWRRHLEQEGEAFQGEGGAGEEGAADVVGALAQVAELREHDGHIVRARHRDHLGHPRLLPARGLACTTPATHSDTASTEEVHPHPSAARILNTALRHGD